MPSKTIGDIHANISLSSSSDIWSQLTFKRKTLLKDQGEQNKNFDIKQATEK